MRHSNKWLAIASVAALAMTGCERDRDEDVSSVGDPDPIEATESGRATTEQAMQPSTQTPPQGMRVLPAVEIAAIDVECAPTSVFFETDSAHLGDDDREQLEQLASCLRGMPEGERVTIAGMTDPRASEEYNEVLGRQRAVAVASFLRMNGVEEGRFRIRAVGEEGAADVPELYPAQRAAIAIPRGSEQQSPTGETPPVLQRLEEAK